MINNPIEDHWFSIFWQLCRGSSNLKDVKKYFKEGPGRETMNSKEKEQFILDLTKVRTAALETRIIKRLEATEGYGVYTSSIISFSCHKKNICISYISIVIFIIKFSGIFWITSSWYILIIEINYFSFIKSYYL